MVRAELKTHQVRGSMLSPSTYSPHMHPVPPITNSFCLSVPAEITSNTTVLLEKMSFEVGTSDEKNETVNPPYIHYYQRSPQVIFQ